MCVSLGSSGSRIDSSPPRRYAFCESQAATRPRRPIIFHGRILSLSSRTLSGIIATRHTTLRRDLLVSSIACSPVRSDEVREEASPPMSDERSFLVFRNLTLVKCRFSLDMSRNVKSKLHWLQRKIPLVDSAQYSLLFSIARARAL